MFIELDQYINSRSTDTVKSLINLDHVVSIDPYTKTLLPTKIKQTGCSILLSVNSDCANIVVSNSYESVFECLKNNKYLTNNKLNG